MSKSKERKESFSEYAEHKCTTNLNDDGALSIYCDVCSEPHPTRVQDLLAVNVTSQSQADRVNRNACRYSVVILVLFICK